MHPGQDIEYIAVDDEKSFHDCVALAHENSDSYDASYYVAQLIRAVESILPPLGSEGADIRETLAETQEYRLAEF